LSATGAPARRNDGTLKPGTLGGDDRIRTGDLLLAKQALYQLSYIPL
jgi:hypothetical protein